MADKPNEAKLYRAHLQKYETVRDAHIDLLIASGCIMADAGRLANEYARAQSKVASIQGQMRRGLYKMAKGQQS